MKTGDAFEIVKRALKNPVITWLNYTPQNIPLVLFDKSDFIFINHPHPPTCRPDTLDAATAIEIDGVLTATLPVEMCDGESTLISMLYHECFHVYQGQKFNYDAKFIFFEILSFYPELNPKYRALCSAEIYVLNNTDITTQKKAKLLSAIAKNRWQILSAHTGMLDFEKSLEITEGTASFVEQKAVMELFGVTPNNSVSCYGFSRQYFTGAGFCWLFEKMYQSKEWQEKIERGLAISGLISETDPDGVDTHILNLADREIQEELEVKKIILDTDKKIEQLDKTNTITIKLPSTNKISRSFDPMSMVSFGDGRVIHFNFVIISTPNGNISIKNQIALENFKECTITFSAESYELKNNILNICTEKVQVSLENIEKLSDSYFDAVLI